MSDIIDRISELVDEQLQQEPSGYDHNINQGKCWHCGREWHGLPITQRIAGMYARRTYDEGYSLAEDDSPVLCHGSDFIGPMPRPRGPRITAVTIGSSTPPNWIDQAIAAASAFIEDVTRTIVGLPPEPTQVQFCDVNFDRWYTAQDVTNWQWSDDRARARFQLVGPPPVPAGEILRMLITTEDPRRVWRVNQVTTYESGRQVFEVFDTAVELETLRRLTEWPQS